MKKDVRSVVVLYLIINIIDPLLKVETYTSESLPHEQVLTNIKSKDILKEFEEKYSSFELCNIVSKPELNRLKDFISKAIDQTIEETIKEAIKKINKIKIAVAKQAGAFKYDSCYEDCVDILNKLKK